MRRSVVCALTALLLTSSCTKSSDVTPPARPALAPSIPAVAQSCLDAPKAAIKGQDYQLGANETLSTVMGVVQCVLGTTFPVEYLPKGATTTQYCKRFVTFENRIFFCDEALFVDAEFFNTDKILTVTEIWFVLAKFVAASHPSSLFFEKGKPKSLCAASYIAHHSKQFGAVDSRQRQNSYADMLYSAIVDTDDVHQRQAVQRGMQAFENDEPVAICNILDN